MSDRTRLHFSIEAADGELPADWDRLSPSERGVLATRILINRLIDFEPYTRVANWRRPSRFGCASCGKQGV